MPLTPEEWLRGLRGAAARMSLERLQGLPRSRIVECKGVDREGPWLLCRGSWWLPRGVLAFIDIVEEDYLPLYTGPAWLEASRGGLLVESLDASLAAVGASPRRLLVKGYASPEELLRGIDLEELGATEFLDSLRAGGGAADEAAARLMAAVAGALLLRRYGLPAPATWAPEHTGGWLRRRSWGYEAEVLVLYVSPWWQPYTGPAPGMAVAPAAVVEAAPGPVLVEAGGGWVLRL